MTKRTMKIITRNAIQLLTTRSYVASGSIRSVSSLFCTCANTMPLSLMIFFPFSPRILLESSSSSSSDASSPSILALNATSVVRSMYAKPWSPVAFATATANPSFVPERPALSQLYGPQRRCRLLSNQICEYR